jgi:protein gp37
MGETTEIAWCDSTFNPWIGCQKVSAGCDNCYAETLMDKRYGRVQWGPHGERVHTAPANWRKPLQWAKAARTSGKRPRVFSASLADVFDNQAPVGARCDLFNLIRATPELDWLLLTKRPENIAKMLPDAAAWGDGWPNVWLGTTCEDQAAYDRRWPILSRIPAKVRFISYEPAIGPVLLHADTGIHPDWIICGGESGAGYRPMPKEWASELMAECGAARVPFFMKQMAGKKQIPDDLMVRQFPAPLLAVARRGAQVMTGGQRLHGGSDVPTPLRPWRRCENKSSFSTTSAKPVARQRANYAEHKPLISKRKRKCSRSFAVSQLLLKL